MAPVLEKIQGALGEFPVPATEWAGLQQVLGAELLATLVGKSPSSVRRYLAGAPATPDAIGVGLHFVALVAADLAGAYNDIGVRRLFSSWEMPLRLT